MAYSTRTNQIEVKKKNSEEFENSINTIRNLFATRIKIVEEYLEEYKTKAQKSKSFSDLLRFSSTISSFAAPALVALTSASGGSEGIDIVGLFAILVTAFAVTSGTLLNVFNVKDRFASYRVTALQLEKLKNKAETNMELILVREPSEEVFQNASNLLRETSQSLEEIVEKQVEKELDLFTLDDKKEKSTEQSQENQQAKEPELVATQNLN